jgi:cytochrome P450 family 142 subfamily A polypeptide 1
MPIDVDVPFLAAETWDERIHERLRWLRENDPVRWSEPDGTWLISKYADVEAISKDQALFTSAEGVRPGFRIGLIDEGEPRHTLLRNLINRGFTPRRVAKLEQAFREITRECIDAVAARGECDFVEAIAVPLPLLLIAEMIGIRKQDREDFHRWSDDMIAADGRRNEPDVVARAGVAFVEYSAYVTRIIEDRRANPRDDLVSVLTGAKDDGILGEFQQHLGDEALSEAHEGLANNELIMMLVILLVAGNETTRNAISGGMQLLIENPEQRRRLVEDPSLLRGAVDEIVRMVSPVHSFQRTLTADTTLRGRTLKRGDKVLLLYPSANRDAEVYPDPDRFDIDRRMHHLGFGIGPHYCLGANLARMEMRVAFEEILRRLRDAEYAGGGPVIRPSALVRSCMEMRIRFRPEA